MKVPHFLEPLLVQKSAEEIASLQTWRERVFSIIMAIGASLGFIIIVLAIYDQIQRGNPLLLGIYILAYAWILTITFVRRLPYTLRASCLVISLYLLGVLSTLDTGITGDGRVWLLAASMLAAIFIGGKAGLITTVLSFGTWLFLGFSFQEGWLTFPYQHMEEMLRNEFKPWFNTGITAFATTLALAASVTALINNLLITLQKSLTLTEGLEDKTSQLEEQAAVLKRRSQTLETSAEISRTVTSLLEPEQILHRATNLVNEAFGLLQTSIFLLDQSGASVSLKASSGGEGRTVPAPGYRIPLREGLIDWVIKNSQPRAIAEDDESGHLLEVRLADSRSQAVLPLRTREKVLGVIVLQSQEPRAFDPNTLTSLQIMADQIAIQLDNARLFSEREIALESERRAYGQITYSTWKDFLQTHVQRGYRRDQDGIRAITSAADAKAKDDTRTRTIPIQVRGQVIGYIDAQKSSGNTWNPTEKEFLETLTKRLESAMDTARLYEETQKRAAYEHIVSETTARMRETLDLESILKTATQELRTVLDLAEVEVRMGTGAQAKRNYPQNKNGEDQ